MHCTYPTKSLPWLPMTWRRKKSGHQQKRYWSNSPRIISQPQHQGSINVKEHINKNVKSNIFQPKLHIWFAKIFTKRRKGNGHFGQPNDYFWLPLQCNRRKGHWWFMLMQHKQAMFTDLREYSLGQCSGSTSGLNGKQQRQCFAHNIYIGKSWHRKRIKLHNIYQYTGRFGRTDKQTHTDSLMKSDSRYHCQVNMTQSEPRGANISGRVTLCHSDPVRSGLSPFDPGVVVWNFSTGCGFRSGTTGYAKLSAKSDPWLIKFKF